MGSWGAGIKGHAFFSNLEQLEKVINEDKPINFESEDYAEVWGRCEFIVKLAKKLTVNEILLSMPLLTAMNDALVGLNGRFHVYLHAGFDSAEDTHRFCDSVLYHLCQIPKLNEEESIGGLSVLVENFRVNLKESANALKEQILNLKDERDHLASQVSNLSGEVESHKRQLDSAISGLQQRYESMEAGWQDRLNRAESQRFDNFDVKLKEWSVSADDITTRNEEKLKGLSEKFLNDAGVLLKSIEDNKEKSDEVLGIISANAVAYGYGSTANRARVASKRWEIFAVAVTVAWISAASYFFYSTYAVNVPTVSLLRQVFVSIPFFLLAGFAARQAANQRKIEIVNRRLELEMATIDPYLADLEEAVRRDVKRSLAEKFFRNSEADSVLENKNAGTDKFSILMGAIKEVKEMVKPK